MPTISSHLVFSIFFVLALPPKAAEAPFLFDRNRTTPLGWNWDEIIFIFVCIYLFLFFSHRKTRLADPRMDSFILTRLFIPPLPTLYVYLYMCRGLFTVNLLLHSLLSILSFFFVFLSLFSHAFRTRKGWEESSSHIDRLAGSSKHNVLYIYFGFPLSLLFVSGSGPIIRTGWEPLPIVDLFFIHVRESFFSWRDNCQSLYGKL